jgi:uncharacterized protein YydD (DUF2326 family)
VIHAVRANDPRFKTLRLHRGLNVVLADTTEASTATDTRNGVGKTLLMEVVQFCLGASAPRSGGLASPALTGWAFTIAIDLDGKLYEASRALSAPSIVTVAGDFGDWPVQPTWDKESSAFKLTLDEWKQVLGASMFDLGRIDGGYRYRPTLRGLIPYFARVRSGAYSEPFKYFSGQREWQKQVYMAYLLDLAWEHAARFQELKDQKEALHNLAKALKEGALGDPESSVGGLRAQRVRTIAQITSLEAQLATFEVHPEYREIARDADRLTQELHSLVNDRLIRQRTLALYNADLAAEQGPGADEVVALFERVGVELPDSVKRTLDEAQTFHMQVVQNRRDYLRDEMEALRSADQEAEAQTAALSEQRARLVEILETKHALDELNKLNGRLSEFRAEVAQLDGQIARINEVDERRSALEIATQELLRESRRELAEREPQWGEAIQLFADNTEALYGSPGELVIEINDSGFFYEVQIERSGSHGIDNMQIFALDLMLAQRWATKATRPGFLWHDSQIYDGVDERQVGAALQLAAREAEARGFQYFCSLNSDEIPPAEYLGDLTIEPVLTLTDATDDGGLFGMRF